MKIIFFGSDDFAEVHLKALCASGHKVVACVTQPDKAKGRGMKVSFSVIKSFAVENKIPVFQPDDLLKPGLLAKLEDFAADLFVVIAYGKFLPSKILALPKRLCINVHSSLLPKYRGAAPINWAVISGEKTTGITIMKVSAKMDAGDILDQLTLPIGGEDTSISLRKRMMEVGPEFLLKAIEKIEKNQITFRKQNEKDATFAPKLTKELGAIRWAQSNAQIYNLIRGLLPWPTAYTFYNGKMLKILRARMVEKDVKGLKPGEVYDVNKEGACVATSDGGVLIQEVHLESSKPMSMQSFVVGHKLAKGYCFS